MKKLFLAFFIVLINSSASLAYDFKILKVIDGDTLIIETPFLLPELGNSMGLRIQGVDTPEKPPRAKCSEEAEKGLKATAYTRNLIAKSKSRKIIIKDWDKYGGRLIGDVLIDGELLSKKLIESRLAVPYDGGKKLNWCEFLKK